MKQLIKPSEKACIALALLLWSMSDWIADSVVRLA